MELERDQDIVVDLKTLSLCRLCITNKGVFHITKKMRQNIQLCFNIEVDEYDGMSQIICDICRQLVVQVLTVRESYRNNQMKAHKKSAEESLQTNETSPIIIESDNDSISSKNTEKEVIFHQECAIMQNVNLDVNDNNMPLKIANSPNNKKLTNNINSEGASKENISVVMKNDFKLNCQFCNKNFRRNEQLIKHISRRHKNLSEKINSTCKSSSVSLEINDHNNGWFCSKRSKIYQHASEHQLYQYTKNSCRIDDVTKCDERPVKRVHLSIGDNVAKNICDSNQNNESLMQKDDNHSNYALSVGIRESSSHSSKVDHGEFDYGEVDRDEVGYGEGDHCEVDCGDVNHGSLDNIPSSSIPDVLNDSQYRKDRISIEEMNKSVIDSDDDVVVVNFKKGLPKNDGKLQRKDSALSETFITSEMTRLCKISSGNHKRPNTITPSMIKMSKGLLPVFWSKSSTIKIKCLPENETNHLNFESNEIPQLPLYSDIKDPPMTGHLKLVKQNSDAFQNRLDNCQNMIDSNESNNQIIDLDAEPNDNNSSNLENTQFDKSTNLHYSVRVSPSSNRVSVIKDNSMNYSKEHTVNSPSESISRHLVSASTKSKDCKIKIINVGQKVPLSSKDSSNSEEQHIISKPSTATNQNPNILVSLLKNQSSRDLLHGSFTFQPQKSSQSNVVGNVTPMSGQLKVTQMEDNRLNKLIESMPTNINQTSSTNGKRKIIVLKKTVTVDSIINRQNMSRPQITINGRQNMPVPQTTFDGGHNMPVPQTTLSGRQNMPVPHTALSGRQNIPVPQTAIIGRQDMPVPQTAFSGGHNIPVPQTTINVRQNMTVPIFSGGYNTLVSQTTINGGLNMPVPQTTFSGGHNMPVPQSTISGRQNMSMPRTAIIGRHDAEMNGRHNAQSHASQSAAGSLQNNIDQNVHRNIPHTVHYRSHGDSSSKQQKNILTSSLIQHINKRKNNKAGPQIAPNNEYNNHTQPPILIPQNAANRVQNYMELNAPQNRANAFLDPFNFSVPQNIVCSRSNIPIPQNTFNDRHNINETNNLTQQYSKQFFNGTNILIPQNAACGRNNYYNRTNVSAPQSIANGRHSINQSNVPTPQSIDIGGHNISQSNRTPQTVANGRHNINQPNVPTPQSIAIGVHNINKSNMPIPQSATCGRNDYNETNLPMLPNVADGKHNMIESNILTPQNVACGRNYYNEANMPAPQIVVNGGYNYSQSQISQNAVGNVQVYNEVNITQYTKSTIHNVSNLLPPQDQVLFGQLSNSQQAFQNIFDNQNYEKDSSGNVLNTSNTDQSEFIDIDTLFSRSK